jgi:hypothetical protein
MPPRAGARRGDISGIRKRQFAAPWLDKKEDDMTKNEIEQQVTVIAFDTCLPIEYEARGRLLPGGVLEVEYPFADSDGRLPSPDSEVLDSMAIDMDHFILPDGAAVKIDGQITVKSFAKQFLAEWGSDFVIPGKSTVGFDQFTDGNGYDGDDRVAVNRLRIGETWRGDQYSHTVTRLANVAHGPAHGRSLSRDSRSEHEEGPSL